MPPNALGTGRLAAQKAQGFLSFVAFDSMKKASNGIKDAMLLVHWRLVCQ